MVKLLAVLVLIFSMISLEFVPPIQAGGHHGDIIILGGGHGGYGGYGGLGLWAIGDSIGFGNSFILGKRKRRSVSYLRKWLMNYD